MNDCACQFHRTWGLDSKFLPVFCCFTCNLFAVCPFYTKASPKPYIPPFSYKKCPVSYTRVLILHLTNLFTAIYVLAQPLRFGICAAFVYLASEIEVSDTVSRSFGIKYEDVISAKGGKTKTYNTNY